MTRRSHERHAPLHGQYLAYPLQPAVPQRRSLDVVGLLVGSAALLGLLFVPATELRIGTSDHALALIDVKGLGVGLAAIIVVLTALSLVGLRSRRRKSAVGTVGYIALGALTAAGIASVEWLQGLIPDKLLPGQLEEYTVATGATIVPWLALLAIVVNVLAATGRFGWAARRLTRRWAGETGTGHRTRLLIGAGATLGVGVVAWARYQPLLVVQAGDQPVEVAAYAVPVIGPASMGAVLVLAALVGLTVFGVGRAIPPRLGMATAVFVAATSLFVALTSGVVFKAGVADWVTSLIGGDVAPGDPDAGVAGWGAAGGSIVVLGMLAVAATRPSRGPLDAAHPDHPLRRLPIRRTRRNAH